MKRWLWVLASISGLAAVYVMIKRWADMMQRQVEAEIQGTLSEERRRFIQRLDHELKNPLTAMRVNLANLAETDDQEERRQIRANMQEQIMRLTHLVNGLRKLANLDMRPIEQLPVDLSSLIQQLIVVIKDHPGAKERRLVLPTLDTLMDLPYLIGDEDLLQLAIYNLLDNALKFTYPNNTVEFRVWATADTVIIEVEDNGQGIPEEDLPYVWEELYRSKAVHGIPGSGLGLAMVKTVVELHDGDVEIVSQRYKGTTVTLTLPLGSSDEMP